MSKKSAHNDSLLIFHLISGMVQLFGAADFAMAIGAANAMEEEVWMFFSLLLFVHGLFLCCPVQRNPSEFEQCSTWSACGSKHSRKSTFKIRLRMTESSFNKLLSCICEELVVNDLQANPRRGPITPELCWFCTLRWLAGGSHLDICDTAGVSKASFCRAVWKTICAPVRCNELKIEFPKSDVEVQCAMEGTTSVSFMAAINDCVGVVDGHLMRIMVPSRREVGNVVSHFSSHCQCCGVNTQAVANHTSRFLFPAFVAPGVTNARDAMQHCGLDALTEQLPFGTCIIGDNAREATEHLVPLCGSVDRMDPACDNFNFCASQLGIGVEMAFGMMQVKWGISQRPICCSMNNVKWMIQAVGRSHNFVSNERLEADSLDSFDPIDPTNEPAACLPGVPHCDQDGNVIGLRAIANPSLQRSHSESREVMVNRVKALGLE